MTGIGSGIGKATAIQLSKHGFFDSYALLGRSRNTIIETLKEMKKNTEAEINVYEVDLNYPENIPNIVDAIYGTFGNISCLLNIAGYTDPQPLLTTTLESFEETYKVNVYSPFILIRESVRYMKSTGGKILNVGSTAGMTPRPGWLSYSSSKAAIISMSQTLTEELAEYGIKVYCISPGRCATKLRKRLAPDEDPKSIMQPEDVAEIICNLISPSECCLDGQNIVIRKQLNKGHK
jgi:3-oxoacyl-[acyl-carrier protein] reductase